MEFKELITNIKESPYFIPRGVILDWLMENIELWAMVLKALLIDTPERKISRDYMLEKLKQVGYNLETPWVILGSHLIVFHALVNYARRFRQYKSLIIRELKTGDKTRAELSDALKMKQTSVYEILCKLETKGVISRYTYKDYNAPGAPKPFWRLG